MKLRSSRNAITSIHDGNGNRLQDPHFREKKCISFLTKLMGTTAEQLPCPYIELIRKGPCLTNKQKCSLIAPMTEQ
ncbi:hypothetical protein RDI58_019881 [Solanum bulbocastanum]|uniref:Uncharacterized protein n=1 Tax=Solanum bulbocastanum TaxID=147425 RepID=A0AAN8T7L1_SOLBU